MTTSTAVERPTASRWVSVGMLALGAFAIGTDGFVVAGILGGIAGDLGVTTGTAGLTVTVFALGYAIGSPLLTSALGGRRLLPVLAGSLTLFGLFNVLAAVAPTFGVLIAARLLCALAAGLYLPSAGAAAAAMVPPAYRGRALSAVLGGASAATVIGAPAGIALAAAFSWRATFVLVAVLSAIAVAGLLIGRPPVGATAKLSLGQRLRPLRMPAVIGAVAVTFLGMAGSYGVYTYLDPLFAGVPGIDAPTLGVLVAVYGVGGVTGTWLGGWLADRWGPYRTILASLGLLTVLFAVSPLLNGALVGAGVFMVAWGVIGWSFVPAQQHRLVGLTEDRAPLLLSLNASALYLGIASGSLLGGLVVEAAGAGRLWIMAVAAFAVAGVLHATTGRLPKEPAGRG